MKNVGSRVTALTLMLILCAVIGIYRLGWFDVTLISRPYTPETDRPSSSGTSGTENTSDELPSDSGSTDSTQQGVPSDDSSDTTAPPQSGDGPEEVIFMPFSDAEADGYDISYADWGSDGSSWILALADVSVPTYFSSTTEIDYDISFELSRKKDEIFPVYTEKEVIKPALKLYMGYILIETDNEKRTNIYSSEGKLIGSYDHRQVSPAMCRDTKDRPLFTYKDSYYYLDEKRGRFVESDYDPKLDGRGAEFDYTPDYGRVESSRTFLHKEETVTTYELLEGQFDAEGYPLAIKTTKNLFKFALAKTSGAEVTGYDFFGRYNFSGGRSAVIAEDGKLFYINTSGKTVIKSTSSRKDPNLDGWSVYDHLMPPLTNGKESIGFYFFEYGLCRVRINTINKWYYDDGGVIHIVNDDDYIIREDGKQFSVPTGYDILSYSDGMILLKKNGKYGYMSYTGEWIVDPYLTYAEPFYEGVAVISMNGDHALIDTNGNYVIPFGTFDYISHASTGVISAYGDDGWKVLYKCEKESD